MATNAARARGLTTWLASAVCLAAACQESARMPGSSGEALPPGVDPARVRLTLDEIPGAPVVPPAVDPTTQPAMAQAAYSRFSEAQGLFRQQRYAEAVQELEKALRYDRRQPQIHRLLALACYLSGSCGDSRARLSARDAVELNPRDEACWFVLGRLAMKSGQPDQALRFFRTALKCPPDPEWAEYRVLAHLHLGLLLDDLGYARAAIDELDAFDRGLALLNDAQKAHPEIEAVRKTRARSLEARRARAYARLGDHRRAAAIFAAPAAEAPDDRAVQEEYARLLVLARRPHDAAEVARTFVRRQNASRESLELLVAVHEWAGTKSRCADDLRTLAAEYPDSRQLSLELARSLIALNRLDEAARTLQDVRQRHPEESEASWLLVEVLRRREKWDAWAAALADALAAAEEQYPRVRQEVGRLPQVTRLSSLAARWANEARGRPNEAAVLFVAAAVAREAGDVVAAEAYLRRAVDRQPDGVAARLALGEILADQYRWTDVVAVAEGGLKTGRPSHSLEWLAGSGYDALDDVEQAVRHYEAALAANPKDRRTRASLGQLYQRIGDVRKAIDQYRRLLEIDPLDGESRDQWLRLYVAAGDLNAAAVQLLAIREKHGDASTVYRRCEAFFKLVQTRDQDLYRETLAAIVKADPADVRTREDLLRVLFVLRRYDEAAEQAKELRRLDPRQTTALEFQALLAVRSLDFDEGAETLRLLLERHPNREIWAGQLARLYSLLLQHERAMALWARLAEAPSAKARRALYRARLLAVYEQAGQTAKMRALAEEWFNAAPADVQVRGLVLAADTAAKDYERVRARVSAWLKDDPKQGAMWRGQLIQALTELKRYDEAQAVVLTWLGENPDDSSLVGWLATALAEAGRYDDAKEWVRNAILTAPNDETREAFRHQLYSIQVQARDYADAIDTLRQLPREEGDIETEIDVGRLLVQAERFDEAEQHLKSAMERTPGNAEKAQILRLLSLASQNRKQPAAAEQRLVDAYKLVPDDVGINNDLAYLWADSNRNLEAAERMLRYAVGENAMRFVAGIETPRELATMQAAYLDSLGWLHYKKGEFDEAGLWLSRAAGMRPTGDDPVIYDHLGDTQWRLGRSNEAVESWRKSASLAEERLERGHMPEDAETRARALEKAAAAAGGRKPGVAPTAAEAVHTRPVGSSTRS